MKKISESFRSAQSEFMHEFWSTDGVKDIISYSHKKAWAKFRQRGDYELLRARLKEAYHE